MTKTTLRRAVAGGALTLAVAFAGNAYAHGGPEQGRTIRLAEAHAVPAPDVVDIGKPGATTGDLVVVRDGLNHQDGAHAGDLTQTCTLMVPGKTAFDSTYDCYGSISLGGGVITFQGPFDPRRSQQYAAVTGGTGVYRAARGDVEIRAEADQLIVRLLDS
jgi:hypothetical protein